MGATLVSRNQSAEELKREFPAFYKMLENKFYSFYDFLKNYGIDNLKLEAIKRNLLGFFSYLALTVLYSKKNEELLFDVKKFEELSYELQTDNITYKSLYGAIKIKFLNYIFFAPKKIIVLSNQTPEELKFLRREYIDMFLYFFDKNIPTNRLLMHACQIYYDNEFKTHPKTKRIGIFQGEAIDEAQEIGDYLKFDTFIDSRRYLEKELGKLLKQIKVLKKVINR